MIKKSLAKYIGLTLAVVLVLSACSKKTADTENPEVVLEKAITQAAKIYEMKGDVKVAFKEPTSEVEGKVTATMTGKTNNSDYNDVHSELALEIDADITGPNPSDTSATGNVKVAAAGKMQMVGDDLYASLTKLDIDGDLEGIEQVKAMLPLFVGPYMDETVHLPLGQFMEMAEQANAQMGQKPMDFEALKKYSAEQLPKDLADSKMLKVSKDNGVESIKTLGGDSVDAYHYTLQLDADGFETFMKKYNEKIQVIPEEQIELMFDQPAGQPGFAEAMTVFNEALNMEVWIGQTDYQVYKVVIGTDKAKIKAAAEKVNEIEEGSVTESDLAQLEKMDLEVGITVETQPLDSFTIEKPSEEDVIDLGPMLEQFSNAAMGGMMGSGAMDPSLMDPSVTVGTGEIPELTEEQKQMMRDQMKAQGMTDAQIDAAMDQAMAQWEAAAATVPSIEAPATETTPTTEAPAEETTTPAATTPAAQTPAAAPAQ